jgi:hypothetical protein
MVWLHPSDQSHRLGLVLGSVDGHRQGDHCVDPVRRLATTGVGNPGAPLGLLRHRAADGLADVLAERGVGQAERSSLAGDRTATAAALPLRVALDRRRRRGALLEVRIGPSARSRNLQMMSKTAEAVAVNQRTAPNAALSVNPVSDGA